MQNFVDALSAARRKAMLTGQPLTSQELNGLAGGYFDAASVMNAKNRALAISEKNAADQLALERYNAEQQMEAAKKAQYTQMAGNILNTGGSLLGVDLMTSKPGESLISKGYNVAKNAVGAGMDLIGLGGEDTIPTFTEALKPALIDATGTGGGISLMPEAAGTVEAGIGGAVAEGGAEVAADAAIETGTGAAGSGIMGTLGKTLGYIMPYAGYYGAAKAGAHLVDAIIQNNPGLKGTALDVFNGSLKEPLAVEQYYGDWLAEHGVGNARTNEIVADVLNPVGGLITDTENTAKMFATGGLSNINSDTNVPAAILSGGVTAVLGTFVCTELFRQGHLTKEVFEADAKFGKQMDKVEYTWYKTWGVPLAKKMAKSKLITLFVKFFMKPVSLYMASEMGVGEGSLFGKIVFRSLQYICKLRSA